MLIVLWRNVRMIRQIARIYAGRTGRYGTWVLVKRAFQSLLVAGIGESVTDLLPAGLSVRLLGALGQCIGNAFMSCRVGVAAQRECRPLPFSPSRHPLREVTSSVIGQVWRRTTDEKPEPEEPAGKGA